VRFITEMKSHKMIEVKLPKRLITQVEQHVLQTELTTEQQIENWIKLGMMAEEHPELPLSFVKDLVQVTK